MSVPKIRCRRCGRRKPHDEEHFRKTAPPGRTPALQRTCKACLVGPGRRLLVERAKARRAAPTRRCPRCRKEFPQDEEHFETYNGLARNCWSCTKLQKSDYAASPAGRQSRRRYARTKKGRERSRRYYHTPDCRAGNLRRRVSPLGRARAFAGRTLRKALCAGTIVRPARCAACRAGRVEAFWPDLERPFDVIWACRSCGCALRKGVPLAELREERRGLERPPLEVSRAEFELIHRRHVFQLAAERARAAAVAAAHAHEPSEVLRRRLFLLDCFGDQRDAERLAGEVLAREQEAARRSVYEDADRWHV